jgi:hypothetical protein
LYESGTPAIPGEERFNFLPKRRILQAPVVQEGMPVGRRKIQDGMKQLLNAVESLGASHGVVKERICRWSHTLVNRQSSFTVSGEILSIAAVCSTVSPTKNRSSTTWACRRFNLLSCSSASSRASKCSGRSPVRGSAASREGFSPSPAAFLRLALSRVVHQDTAHGLRHGAEGAHEEDHFSRCHDDKPVRVLRKFALKHRTKQNKGETTMKITPKIRMMILPLVALLLQPARGSVVFENNVLFKFQASGPVSLSTGQNASVCATNLDKSPVSIVIGLLQADTGSLLAVKQQVLPAGGGTCLNFVGSPNQQVPGNVIGLVVANASLTDLGARLCRSGRAAAAASPRRCSPGYDHRQHC